MHSKFARLAALAVLLASVVPSTLNAQSIDDVFVPLSPSETVTAPLAVGGVLTSQAYSGLVRLDASGFGTNNVASTDNYYAFERSGQPVPPVAPPDGSWLAVGEESGSACLDFSNSVAHPVSNLTVFINGVGTVAPGPTTVPAYSTDHRYSVVIDLGQYAGGLYVGNRDCGFFDNSGQLVVTLTMVERACTVDSDCDDGNVCTDEGCDADFGCVVIQNSAPCDDGNACTRTDGCQQGVCLGSDPVVCTASDQCHEAGTCDPESGACSNPPAPVGTLCDDGNRCTRTDTCQEGFCAGSSPVACAAADQCHDAGTCDPGTGSCDDPAKADGTACSDDDACTLLDTCQAGTCESGSPILLMPLANVGQTLECIVQTLPVL